MNAERRDLPRAAGRWTLIALAGLLLASTAAAEASSRGTRPSREEMPLLPGRAFDVAKASATDPVGDTFGGGQIDAIGLSAEVVGGNLVIATTFAGAISPPDSLQPNALDMLIDLDVDQDGNTGLVPWADLSNPAGMNSGMGSELYVDLLSYDGGDGTVDVLDSFTDAAIGEAGATFGPSSATVSIPLSLLGGDGSVNVVAVAGTVDGDFTDVVPNSGSVSSGDGGGGGAPTSVLLNDNRFLVSVDWSAPPNFPDTRPAFVSDLGTPDSAIFYFLDPDNLEFLIKVLNGCDGDQGFYWVFFAATTNVEFTVTVTDTLANETQTYSNPLGQPADAVTDTMAFATCP